MSGEKRRENLLKILQESHKPVSGTKLAEKFQVSRQVVVQDIALHVDKELETGYFLRMNPKNQLVAWDMWPRGEQGRYQWQIKGDVPYQIETARKLPKAEEYRVHIIKEKDICVVYINDEIVLSTRMYNHKDGYAGIYVVQGNVKLIQYKEKRSE